MLEFRAAIRRVLLHPLMALSLVLLVGLAVGVNTAVFALVSRVLLAELPYSAPAELVRVWTGGREDAAGSMGPLDYRTIADTRAGALASVAAYRRAELQLGGTAAPPVAGLFITPSLFEVLHSWPRCLSAATVDALRNGGHRIALVREDYARRNGLDVSCGAAQNLIIDGEPHYVAGTITDAVRLLGDEAQVFVVFEPQQIRVMEGSVLSVREAHVQVLARLAPGVSLDTAARQLSPSGGFQGSRAVRLISMKQEQTQRVAGSILLLQVLAVFVLVVTIINLAQILQAHAYERAADAAVRASLGASFWRSHQSLAMELCLMTAGGATAAVVVHRVTWGGLQRFGPAAPPQPWLDSSDALQVVLVGALTVLLCGLAPILPVLFRMRLTGAALLSSSRGSAARAGLTRGDLRVSQCLLAAQAAVMTAGVVVGALLLRSTSNLLAVDLGFDAADVMAAPLRITRPVFTERVEALQSLLDSVAQDPTSRYAIASNIPLTTTVTVKVRVPGSDDRDVLAHRIDVTAGYFDILKIALRRGRGFAAGDSGAGEPVAIVSEEFGRKFLDDRPLGRTMIVGGATWRVVGVVEDVLSNGVRSLGTPTLYIHLPQAQLGVLGNPRLVLQRAELLMTTTSRCRARR
jgi:putative ABC transport system permease protein